jgi:L-rhamnose mutarotase
MKRVAFKMFLKNGFEDEYQKRHNEIWPELKVLLQETGVFDYSICLDKNTNILYASHKLKGNVGAQDLGQNPIVKRWWAFMADIMETNPDNSPKTEMLEELFYME